MNNPKFIKYETSIQLVPSSKRQLNKQFALVDILLCYHGDNRNRTSISKSVIENSLYSLYGIPIVGEYIYLDDGSQDFGSHGGKIIISDNGIQFEDTTKPYGFVTKDAVDNAKWVDILEKDGHTHHEYLKLEGCIVWQDRYEEISRILDENYGQSMEIEIERGHWNSDGFFEVEQMVFSAACILGSKPDGEDVIPCFESACIGRHYKLDSFKQDLQFMLDEYKKYQNSENNKEGVEQMELTKFVEALSQIKIGDTDSCKYALLNCTDTKVNVIDLEDYKGYSFDYTVDSDDDGVESLVIDYDSKCEMSLSVCDKINDENFQEFSIQDVINEKAEQKLNSYTEQLEVEFNKKLQEMADQYEQLNTEYTAAVKELEVFRADDKTRKEKEHKEALDKIVAEFNKKLSRVPEFLVYKARLDYSKSEEDVTRELTLMAGKHVMDAQTQANFSYHPVTTSYAGQQRGKNDEMTARYGNLFDNFTK